MMTILYRRSRSAKRAFPVASLRERILQATSPQEISNLLAEGQDYAKATGRTRKQWSEAATQRREELLDEVAAR